MNGARLRAAFALLVLPLVMGACGAPAKSPAPPLPPLHLTPTTDLVAAAGLSWMLDAKPRALMEHVELAQAVQLAISDAKFRYFRDNNGGVELRTLEELVVADYDRTTLFLLRGSFSPAHIERDFKTHVEVEGRGVDRQSDALGTIIRTWGSNAQDEREQVAIFGHEALGLERGEFGPLRTAELFAQGKLKRSATALSVEPLAQAQKELGDAPLVVYVRGPFGKEWSHGLGGLLAASTGLAVAVRPADSDRRHDGDLLAVTVALYGAWGKDADQAASRLTATLHLFQESAIGKLCGVDHPVVGPRTRATSSEIAVDLSFDSARFFAGIADSTTSSVQEILGGMRE
ncbi:MAG: hypothetical protein ABI551_10320 [Polyangiaceae bacterium]